jgi:hypothetical protein
MAEKKKWYETGVGKVVTSPFISPVGALAKVVSKGIEKDIQKGKELRQKQEGIVSDIGKMQLAPETTAAYEQAMAAAKQGLDPYTRQQMLERLGMGTQTALGLFRAGRMGLAKVSDIDRSMRAGLMQFGAAEAQARRQNLGLATQAGLSVGQQRTALDRYKLEGLYNYVTGRRAERRQTLTSALTGAAQIAAMMMKPKVPSTTTE